MLRVSRLEALSALKSKPQQNGFKNSIAKAFAGPSTAEQTPRRSYSYSSAVPNTQQPEPQLVFPPRGFSAFPRAELPPDVEVFIQQDHDTIEASCRSILRRAEVAHEGFYVGVRMNRDETYHHQQYVVSRPASNCCFRRWIC